MAGIRQTAFTDYEGFIEKFKPKRTTDDCYTPAAVYKAVSAWVAKEFKAVKKYKVVRPFSPDGDYEAEISGYDSRIVVVDNPPFSMITKICRDYQAAGVKFFLFAPHLTLFSINVRGVSHIITNSCITYENGAEVNTGFVTNLYAEPCVRLSPELGAAINSAQVRPPGLPKYDTPGDVITVSKLSQLLRSGRELAIPHKGCFHISKLDSMRRAKKSIYGSGFLVADRYKRLLQQERVEADRKRAEADKRKVEEDRASRIFWPLSEAEKLIIERLNTQLENED